MKKSTILSQHWYENLVDECKGILTEGVFNSRWVLIETYHKVGELLRNEKRMPISKLVNACAADMNVSERKLWHAVKFYDKYPDIDKLPEGKNISWYKIKTKLLTDSAVKEPAKKMVTCPKCGLEFEL